LAFFTAQVLPSCNTGNSSAEGCCSRVILIWYNEPFGPATGPCQSIRSESPTMAKSKKKAEVIFLVCKETGDYNYTLRRKPGGEKLTLKKYSPRLRKHTEHTEKKK
jgi:large subunit ribosomal protein L33